MAPLLVLFLLLAGCAKPWTRFPNPRAPDEAYSVSDGVRGYGVYAWRCDAGQHVVVYQRCAEWACDTPARELADCGHPTPIEAQLAGSARGQVAVWR